MVKVYYRKIDTARDKQVAKVVTRQDLAWTCGWKNRQFWVVRTKSVREEVSISGNIPIIIPVVP